MINLQDVLSYISEDIIQQIGMMDNNIKLTGIAAIGNKEPNKIDWIAKDNKEKQKLAENSNSRIIICDQEINYNEIIKKQNKVLIYVNEPKLVITKIGNYFFSPRQIVGIHPSAVIHPDAKIGKNVSIGAYSVIGKCNIAEKTIIESNVRIHDNTIIGMNCFIDTGVVIGAKGFGFVKDEKGDLLRFPQLGKVVLGDNVEVGNNTCIDRGALKDTIIGRNTKINNLCHIAHNVTIGENVMITGMVNISGSSVIGDNVWVSPNATIRDYINIGDSAHIGMGAVVTKNIPANELWIGNPARKMLKNNK